jgi:hypothetical protein
MALARQRRAQVPIMIASFLAWSQGRADFSEPHPQVLEQRCVVDLFDLIDLSWGLVCLGVGVEWASGFITSYLRSAASLLDHLLENSSRGAQNSPPTFLNGERLLSIQ